MPDSDRTTRDPYADDLDRTPRLAPEEEAALYTRLRAGDTTARHRLAEGNLRLVVKIARHYRRQRVLAAGDIIQEGNIGLLMAIDRFDPAVGCRFSTYAAFWIHYVIQQALRRNHQVVALPVRKARLADKAAAEMRRRAAEGRETDLDALAAQLQTTGDELAALLAAREAALSLDQPTEEGGTPLGERLASAGLGAPAADGARGRVLRRQVARRVRDALATLPERERAVMVARYGLDGAGEERSLRETGERVGLSQEGVRLIERRALERLRRRSWLAAVAQDLATAWAA